MTTEIILFPASHQAKTASFDGRSAWVVRGHGINPPHAKIAFHKEPNTLRGFLDVASFDCVAATISGYDRDEPMDAERVLIANMARALPRSHLEQGDYAAFLDRLANLDRWDSPNDSWPYLLAMSGFDVMLAV